MVLSNDYKVEVTSDQQTDNALFEPRPVFRTLARAPGNVKDHSNLGSVVFDYGLPTATQVLGFTVEADDLAGFRPLRRVQREPPLPQVPRREPPAPTPPPPASAAIPTPKGGWSTWPGCSTRTTSSARPSAWTPSTRPPCGSWTRRAASTTRTRPGPGPATSTTWWTTTTTTTARTTRSASSTTAARGGSGAWAWCAGSRGTRTRRSFPASTRTTTSSPISTRTTPGSGPTTSPTTPSPSCATASTGPSISSPWT